MSILRPPTTEDLVDFESQINLKSSTDVLPDRMVTPKQSKKVKQKSTPLEVGQNQQVRKSQETSAKKYSHRKKVKKKFADGEYYTKPGTQAYDIEDGIQNLDLEEGEIGMEIDNDKKQNYQQSAPVVRGNARNKLRERILFAGVSPMIPKGSRLQYVNKAGDVLNTGTLIINRDNPLDIVRQFNGKKQHKKTNWFVQCDHCNEFVTLIDFELHSGVDKHKNIYSQIVHQETGQSLKDLTESHPQLCYTDYNANCMGFQSRRKNVPKSQQPKALPNLEIKQDMVQQTKKRQQQQSAQEREKRTQELVEQYGLGLSHEELSRDSQSVCVYCSSQEFDTDGFSENTVLLCDQCEREYHIKCLREHNVCDLKALPEGEWYCSHDCSNISSGLEGLSNITDVPLPPPCQPGQDRSGAIEYTWSIIRNKNHDLSDYRPLKKVLEILQESFDPIRDPMTGVDLLPVMVQGRQFGEDNFQYVNVHSVLLKYKGKPLASALFRVLGTVCTEVPLIATRMRFRRQGVCQLLIKALSYEMSKLNVKKVILPSAKDTLLYWTEKQKFQNVPVEEKYLYLEAVKAIAFPGTYLLQKLIPQDYDNPDVWKIGQEIDKPSNEAKLNNIQDLKQKPVKPKITKKILSSRKTSQIITGQLTKAQNASNNQTQQEGNLQEILENGVLVEKERLEIDKIQGDQQINQKQQQNQKQAQQSYLFVKQPRSEIINQIPKLEQNAKGLQQGMQNSQQTDNLPNDMGAQLIESNIQKVQSQIYNSNQPKLGPQETSSINLSEAQRFDLKQLQENAQRQKEAALLKKQRLQQKQKKAVDPSVKSNIKKQIIKQNNKIEETKMSQQISQQYSYQQSSQQWQAQQACQQQLESPQPPPQSQGNDQIKYIPKKPQLLPRKQLRKIQNQKDVSQKSPKPDQSLDQQEKEQIHQSQEQQLQQNSQQLTVGSQEKRGSEQLQLHQQLSSQQQKSEQSYSIQRKQDLVKTKQKIPQQMQKGRNGLSIPSTLQVNDNQSQKSQEEAMQQKQQTRKNELQRLKKLESHKKQQQSQQQPQDLQQQVQQQLQQQKRTQGPIFRQQGPIKNKVLSWICDLVSQTPLGSKATQKNKVSQQKDEAKRMFQNALGQFVNAKDQQNSQLQSNNAFNRPYLWLNEFVILTKHVPQKIRSDPRFRNNLSTQDINDLFQYQDQILIIHDTTNTWDQSSSQNQGQLQNQQIKTNDMSGNTSFMNGLKSSMISNSNTYNNFDLNKQNQMLNDLNARYGKVQARHKTSFCQIKYIEGKWILNEYKNLTKHFMAKYFRSDEKDQQDPKLRSRYLKLYKTVQSQESLLSPQLWRTLEQFQGQASQNLGSKQLIPPKNGINQPQSYKQNDDKAQALQNDKKQQSALLEYLNFEQKDQIQQDPLNNLNQSHFEYLQQQDKIKANPNYNFGQNQIKSECDVKQEGDIKVPQKRRLIIKSSPEPKKFERIHMNSAEQNLSPVAPQGSPVAPKAEMFDDSQDAKGNLPGYFFNNPYVSHQITSSYANEQIIPDSLNSPLTEIDPTGLIPEVDQQKESQFKFRTYQDFKQQIGGMAEQGDQGILRQQYNLELREQSYNIQQEENINVYSPQAPRFDGDLGFKKDEISNQSQINYEKGSLMSPKAPQMDGDEKPDSEGEHQSQDQQYDQQIDQNDAFNEAYNDLFEGEDSDQEAEDQNAQEGQDIDYQLDNDQQDQRAMYEKHRFMQQIQTQQYQDTEEYMQNNQFKPNYLSQQEQQQQQDIYPTQQQVPFPPNFQIKQQHHTQGELQRQEGSQEDDKEHNSNKIASQYYNKKPEYQQILPQQTNQNHVSKLQHGTNQHLHQSENIPQQIQQQNQVQVTQNSKVSTQSISDHPRTHQNHQIPQGLDSPGKNYISNDRASNFEYKNNSYNAVQNTEHKNKYSSISTQSNNNLGQQQHARYENLENEDDKLKMSNTIPKSLTDMEHDEIQRNLLQNNHQQASKFLGQSQDKPINNYQFNNFYNQPVINSTGMTQLRQQTPQMQQHFQANNHNIGNYNYEQPYNNYYSNSNQMQGRNYDWQYGLNTDSMGYNNLNTNYNLQNQYIQRNSDGNSTSQTHLKKRLKIITRSKQ